MTTPLPLLQYRKLHSYVYSLSALCSPVLYCTRLHRAAMCCTVLFCAVHKCTALYCGGKHLFSLRSGHGPLLASFLLFVPSTAPASFPYGGLSLIPVSWPRPYPCAVAPASSLCGGPSYISFLIQLHPFVAAPASSLYGGPSFTAFLRLQAPLTEAMARATFLLSFFAEPRARWSFA